MRSFVAFAALAALSPLAAYAAPADRGSDPVVLKGWQLPWLAAESLSPEAVVAFRYDGAWHQVPVQVDERDVVEFARVYGYYDRNTNPTGGDYGIGLYEEFYTDSGTFTGPDSNPLFDLNDELVFMAADCGAKAPADSAPAGVVAGTGVEVTVSDPVESGEAYLYLFAHDGSLQQSAGTQYVAYAFNLLSGDYKTTYDLNGGGDDHGPLYNPEDSTIMTSAYERHWSWRWTSDVLRLFAGTGADILEKRDYWAKAGSCGRTNATFNAQEGCFITNKSGPIRAIRSYMGANSGPLMQTEHLYYGEREDLTETVRVHSRGATGGNYMDYSEDAFGMTYANDLNPAGVVIDGAPDAPADGNPDWELVTGLQGSLVICHDLATDVPLPPEVFGLFYEDNLETALTQCQGCDDCAEPEIINDPYMIGAHGPWLDAPLPNTDPRQGEYYRMSIRSVFYYGGPGWDATMAAALRERASSPLTATAIALAGAGDNALPAFNIDPLLLQNGVLGESFTGSLAGSASDTDGDALAFYKISGPPWLHIRPNGEVVGRPGISDVGENEWTVAVSDGHGGMDTATLRMTVLETGNTESQTETFLVTDDAHTREGNGSNFGTQVGVQVKANEYIGWLKFAVQGLPDDAAVISAVLRLHSGPVGMEPEDTTVYAVDDISWTETSITGLNHPALGASLDSSGPVPAGQWVEFDVTAAVAGNGVYAFGLTDTTTLNARGWYSRETNLDPELVVTYGAGNRPPAFLATEFALADATVGEPYTEDISSLAADIDDGDILAFARACCAGKAWLEVAEDGTLSGVPTAADVGTDAYTVQVADQAGAADYAVLFIEVLPAPEYHRADVDHSGEVDAVDVQKVINAALGVASEDGCDIDGVNGVNAVDVQLVINGALGIA